MLESIRTAANTWLAKLILAIITVPFALWGVESYVRNPAGQDVVAHVGDEKITSVDFSNALRDQMEQFRQQFGGNVDASIMDSPEMRKGVLDRLIDERLITAATRASGLSVSDSALRDRISSETAFQQDGKFVPSRYEGYLRSVNTSAPAFEAKLRQDLARQQFIESIAATGFVGTASAQQYLLAAEQSREVAIVNVLPEQFTAQVKVTPEQIKAYYDAHQAEFTIPAQVKPEYLELSIEALAPQIQVSAAEVKEYYDANSVRYGQKEERKASHILIAVAATAGDAEKKAARAKADSLLAQLKKNPKEFAELAKKNSADPGSAVNGGDLGFFARGSMVPQFEEAAFKAKKDEIVGPVQTDYGYHIIRVTDVHEAKIKSLADVTPEIEGELKKQKAQRKFADLAEKFSNLVYEQSTSLKAAAEAVGLQIRQGPFVSKGAQVPPPFNNPKLMTALFSDDVLKNKRNTEAVEVAANTLVAARMLESKPAVVRPFAEVQAAISTRLSREEATKLAVKDGEAKLAALREGKAVDVKFPALLAVSRNNNGGLAPDVIEAAMKANTKSLPSYVGVNNPGGGYVLVQVAKVIAPPPADDAKVKALRARIEQALAIQQIQAVLSQVRNKADVTVAKDVLTKKAEQ
ncbi:MAG TPA: SurA N-terminal domain-containing protein [Usitatibacteraceae bacterium]